MARIMFAQMGPYTLPGVYVRESGRTRVVWALPAIPVGVDEMGDRIWVTPTLTQAQLSVRAAVLGLKLNYFQGGDEDAEDSD